MWKSLHNDPETSKLLKQIYGRSRPSVSYPEKVRSKILCVVSPHIIIVGQIVSESVASLWLSVRVPCYSTPIVDYEIRHTVPATMLV